MKRLIAILLVTIMFAGVLTACAADSAHDTRFFTAEEPNAAPMPLSAEMYEMDMAGLPLGAVADAAQGMPEVPPVDPDSPESPQTGAGDGFAERIIHTATASIETLDFDATINAVYQMLHANGGFVEFSDIGGRSHWQIIHNQPSNRSATFTLRVPQERLATMTGNLELLGNVLSINNLAENVTAQFVDTQARLSTLQVQEERLLHMLGRAEEVSDMIEIEQRLGEVRFQIESMVSMLRNWENRIRFSTLNLFIHEVHELTEIEERGAPYWQRVWNGLMNTFRNIGRFFTNLLMWFIVNLPILIIWAIVIAVAIVVPLRFRRKRKEKRAQAQQAYYANHMNNTNQMGNQKSDNKGKSDSQE